MITSSQWPEEDSQEKILCSYDINPTSKLYSTLRPASQISKHYLEAVLGVPNMSDVHSVVVWLHPKHRPTHLALHKHGAGIAWCKEPGIWDPRNWLREFQIFTWRRIPICKVTSMTKICQQHSGLCWKKYTLLEIDSPNPSYNRRSSLSWSSGN